MGIQDVIAITVAIVALGVIARFMWRSLGGKTGCGCARNKMPGDATCDAAPRTGIKHTPLVDLQPPTPRDDD